MKHRKEKEIKIIFAGIALIFLTFLAVPVVQLLMKSFTTEGGGLTLQNFQSVFARKDFLEILRNSFGVADFAVNANKAYPGVRVGQIDAAGKTADELAALIDEVYGARLAQGSVTIYANDEAEARIADETAAAQDAALAEQLALEEARANKLAWTADAASLEARVPSDELAAEALAVGREDGGILARLAALATGRELKPRAAYAETAVESLASDIDAAIGDPRVDYGIVVEDGTASVTEGHDGFMVNRDELRRTLPWRSCPCSCFSSRWCRYYVCFSR